MDEDVLLVRQPAEDTGTGETSAVTGDGQTALLKERPLPGVFSLDASDVSVESRASDLNFFSGMCSVVW